MKCTNPFCEHTVARVERMSSHVLAADELVETAFFSDKVTLPSELKAKMQTYLETYVGVDFSDEDET